MKLRYKKMLILGTCFLALSFVGATYNSYVPIFLKKFFQSNYTIGFVMSLNNYAGLFILPMFGVFSDRTNTRIGKRMPYLIFGMIAASVILITIPMHWSMVSLIVSIVILNIVFASFRAPLLALMPDFTPLNRRSSANGIINLMGGAGAIISYLIGSNLYNINKIYPFYAASTLILISLIVLYIFTKEKKDSVDCCETHDNLLNCNTIDIEITEEEENEKANNVFFMLMSVFFMFCTFSAVEVFFRIYGMHYLDLGEAGAARVLTIFSLLFVVCSLPAGIIGDRIGRKKAMIIGMSAMILINSVLYFTSSIGVLEVLIGVSGLSWALVYINAYPMLVSMTESKNIGRFTGYYYIFISLSAIITPIILDLLIDMLGYNVLFIYTGLSFIISLILIILVNAETDYNSYHNSVQSDFSVN